MEEAKRAIASMIERSEKAWGKFAPGSAQYTLQKNRIQALRIATALLAPETERNREATGYTREELEKARAPIASLLSKSEKAQTKLLPGTWQHAMLESNIQALQLVMPLLEQTIRDSE